MFSGVRSAERLQPHQIFGRRQMGGQDLKLLKDLLEKYEEAGIRK
jgi:hypothetical protein